MVRIVDGNLDAGLVWVGGNSTSKRRREVL